jgi:tRNA(Ile)-lysidine synthase
LTRQGTTEKSGAGAAAKPAFLSASECIKRYKKPGVRFCAAVSGGVDSVVLLHFLLFQAKLDPACLLVLHIEHGIRGEASKADARFVESLGAAYGVPVTVLSADIPALARAEGVGLESAARDFRRRAFSDVVSEGKARYVLTAHHAGDQTESVLLHMFRGAGLKGLVGMRAYAPPVLRPLLNETKADILAYAAFYGLSYREDATNADTGYDRNYLREAILPLIRGRWEVDKALSVLSLCAEEAGRFMDERLDDSLIVFEGDSAKIGTAALLEGGAAAAGYVLRALEGLNRTADIERKHLLAVVRLAAAQNGKRIDLKYGLRAAKEYEYVTLYTGRAAAAAEELPFAPGMTPFLNGTLTVRGADPLVERGRLRFDADRIPPGAVFRTRREGDVFQPFGGGTKKLKEYLIDKKIPKRLRDGLPVLAVGAEVLAVAGLEIAESIKLTPGSLNVLELEYAEW